MSQYQITTSNLSFSYNKRISGINNLNLLVPEGSIYGFLGRNGSGKTTTIRLLLGLLTPQSGKIRIFHRSLTEKRLICLSKIGALIEDPFSYGHLSGAENLELMSRYYRGIEKHRVEEVLKMVDLQDAGKLKVKEYSLGMKKRLGLALCIIHRPKLLILDEPINGLDPQGIVEFRWLLKRLNSEEGTTIFLSSHILSEAEKLCTHVGFIRNGEMSFQGSIRELQSSKEHNILLEIQTDDLEKTNGLVQNMTLTTPIFINSHLLLTLKEKREIPLLLDKLRANNIDVFEIRIKNDLENYFLNQNNL